MKDNANLDAAPANDQAFLTAICSALQLDPLSGLLVLDGSHFSSDQIQPRLHTLIVRVHQENGSSLQSALMEVYPENYSLTVIRAPGVAGDERVAQLPLCELHRVTWMDSLTALHLSPAHGREVQTRDPWFLARLVQTLREPGGCPWDRKQTHESLRKYALEEAYEVAHAIDEGNWMELCDELGDLLLQVLLHAQIASETGDFTLRDIYSALARKLIRRHPHVFGDEHARNEAEAIELWTQAKSGESQPSTQESLMDQVKWGRAPVRVALDIQEKAASIGFDWDDVFGVMDKLREEVAELQEEINQSPHRQERVADEFGDVLFTLVNVARWLKMDVDSSLQAANRKFAERFRIIEQKLKENAVDIANTGASDLEKYWDQAKISGNFTTDSLG